MNYESSESEYTLCSEKFVSRFGCHRDDQFSRTMSRTSERSSLTRFVQKINDAAYIERPYEDTIQDTAEDIDELEDFDRHTYACEDDRDDTTPRSGSTTKVQTCKAIEDPELKKKREERYNQWLKNKRELALKKRLEERRNEENKKNSLEAKRKKSEEKVKEWMVKKSPKCDYANNTKIGGNVAEKTKTMKFQRNRKSDAANYDDWLIKKKQQERAELEKKEDELRAAHQYEEYRRSLSDAFYKKWCDVSKVKPMPVPLNRGFKTLIGSTTSLYINPDPWQFDN